MTSVLVTGASGLMGRALMEELRSHGRDVVGVGSSDADLRNFDATCALFERISPSIVYHLAARVSGIMGNIRAQGQGFLDNIRINTNAIEAARLAGARKIVAMGSAAIYSDKVPLPMREDEVWTGRPHASEAGYAFAKRAMLAQLETYRDQWGLDYAYCISTNLFGPHDKFDEQHGHVMPSLISKFHRASRDASAVTVWGSGTPRRDFLYAKDAAAAMRIVGDNFTGAINFASGHTVSIAELVDVIRDVSGFNGEVIWDRTKPDGQRLRSYDVTKLRDLAVQPRSSLREAVAETYRWYEANVASARH